MAPISTFYLILSLYTKAKRVPKPISTEPPQKEKINSDLAWIVLSQSERARIIGEISAFALAETRLSELPGWTNGPADAYRHLLVVGEMTRRFGTIPAFAMGEANETWSWFNMQKAWFRGEAILPSNQPESRAMDRHNNQNVAPAIGRAARSPEDVVRGARAAMERAIEKAGSGQNNTAFWRPRAEWVDDGESGNWPRPVWHDLQGQPHITTYRQQVGLPPQPSPVQPSAEAFKLRGGGPVQVRPHQREGHPIQGYQRSAPAR